MRRYLTPAMVGAHLLALVCVTVAGLLGYWQLDSWQAQRTAEARDLTGATPVPLDDVLGPDDGFPGDEVGRPVQVVGTWLPDQTVYVAGRDRTDDAAGDEPGYWVLTPVTTTSGSVLPVVRGWTEQVGSAPAPTGDDADLTAWLQPSEGPGEPLDGDDAARGDVLGSVRTADLAQRVSSDFYSGYAIAQEPGGGLAAVTPAQLPQPDRFTGLRNLLYALEWWVFGAFAAFIWWRFVRDAGEAARVAEATAAAAPPERDTEDDPVGSRP